MGVLGIELIARVSYIKGVLHLLKDDGIEYELLTYDGDNVKDFEGLSPEYYATVADYVSVCKVTPFYKRKKEVARIHYWEKDMRLEIVDGNFGQYYEPYINLKLGKFPYG